MTIKELMRLNKADSARNKGNVKSALVLRLFRLANYVYEMKNKNKMLYALGAPYLVLYRILVEWLLCIELPFGCRVGPGLIIDHGQALIVNKNTIIGDNCRLRNSTTIGCKIGPDGLTQLPSPKIGNNVDVGANSVVLGDISIGDNVIIGAGSVVVKDVPSNSVVAGNPAKVIKNL